jgi:hypothetical protein
MTSWVILWDCLHKLRASAKTRLNSQARKIAYLEPLLAFANLSTEYVNNRANWEARVGDYLL